MPDETLRNATVPTEFVTAGLRDWEDGTDLVLSACLPTDRGAAWLEITDPVRCGEWFAPWQRVSAGGEREDADDDSEDAAQIAFVFGEDTLQAQVLSVSDHAHVLLEIAGLGRVGISLDDAGPGGTVKDTAGDDAPAGTGVTVTHTFESRDAAAAAVPEIGPVWHTHLLMLASALGANVPPVDDATLTAYYTQVAGGEANDD